MCARLDHSGKKHKKAGGWYLWCKTDTTALSLTNGSLWENGKYQMNQIMLHAYGVICEGKSIKITQEQSGMQQDIRAGEQVQKCKTVIRNYNRTLNLRCGGENTISEVDHIYGQ